MQKEKLSIKTLGFEVTEHHTKAQETLVYIGKELGLESVADKYISRYANVSLIADDRTRACHT